MKADGYLSLQARDYKFGMSNLGIPPKKIDRISEGLEKGRMPREVLDVIVAKEKEVSGVHPDRYPWSPETSDELIDGLEQRGINTRSLWADATQYVKTIYNRRMPPLCGIDQGEMVAVANLLEMYALTFYDLPSLRMKNALAGPALSQYEIPIWKTAKK